MTTDNKFIIDRFQLIAGAPIKIPELDLLIHQPKLSEIALIGEEEFYKFLGYFRISKKNVLKNIKNSEQTAQLEYKTEYEILKIFIDSEPEIEYGLSIIFKMLIKDIEIIKFNPFFIFIKQTTGQQYTITDQSFSIIRDIVYQIFNLEELKSEYNTENEMANAIAEKLKKRKEILDSSKGKKDQSMLSDFISILAVGLNSLNINDILNLTIYQIFVIMKRFGKYSQYNIQIQALMQGAEDVELIDWMEKI